MPDVPHAPAAQFTCQRELSAPGPDGVRVPMTLAYRADLRPDGTHPLLLTGYGAYGETLEPGLFFKPGEKGGDAEEVKE